MIHYFIVLALFPLTALSLDCSNLPDGDYEIGCRVYSSCTNGQFSSHECGGGMVYYNATTKCALKIKVPPPCGIYRDCTSIADGSYTEVTQNCTSYYTCFRHFYYGHNLCTPGTIFNNGLGTCAWPADVGPCGS